MNSAKIEAAREDLRLRIAEADEARAALQAAGSPTARRIAQEIYQSRSHGVEQATAFLAASLMIEKAKTVVPAFRDLANDFAFVAEIHQRAKSVGACPPYLTVVTSGLEWELLPELFPEAIRAASHQVDQLMIRLQKDPLGGL